MRGSVSVLLVGVMVVLASASALAQPRDAIALTVRIHDYAHLPIESLESAQEQVQQLYADIGVHTIWATSLRPTESPDPPIARDSEELLINILPFPMSRRLGVAEQILGLAVGTPLERGKVAYVLFDRVRRVAATSARQPADVLGVIIAHELGHLLLPHGSHSPIGLMRGVWHAVDFRVTNLPQQLSFTPAQAQDIRGTLNRAAGHSNAMRAGAAAID